MRAVRAGRTGARLGVYRWGLIPAWVRDPEAFRATFNARSESVAEKSAFRDAWHAGRRCVLVAEAAYEWGPAPRGRKPMLAATAADGGPLLLAGLWEPRKDPATGAASASCTLLTCAPNTMWSAVHHRMPVVLGPDDASQWLDPRLPLADARALCVPCGDAGVRLAPHVPAAA